MPKVTSFELVQKAREKNHAVGAFNVYNLETVQAVSQGSKETSSGVIFQITQSAMQYGGLKNIYNLVMNHIDMDNLTAAIHLDHGPSLEIVNDCLEIGFSSVMLDGSHLEFEDNIAKTKEASINARKYNASCEGELGRLEGVEDHVSVEEKDVIYTNPNDAVQFVDETGINLLAVAIGNAHGFYKGEPHIDFKRLKKIKDCVNVPLVLHGASGIPDNAIKKAISIGIGKINVDTEFRYAFMRGVENFLTNHPDTSDARGALAEGRQKMKERVIEKINLFNAG